MILKRTAVDRPEDLNEINGLIHDAYADPDLLTFDEARREARLLFAQEIYTWMDLAEASLPSPKFMKRPRWPVGRGTVPFFQVNLMIRKVIRMRLGPARLEDPWMLNEFVYEERLGKLVLDAFVGPDLVLDVDGLDFEAEITDHVAVTIGRTVLGSAQWDSPVDELRLRSPDE